MPQYFDVEKFNDNCGCGGNNYIRIWFHLSNKESIKKDINKVIEMLSNEGYIYKKTSGRALLIKQI